MAETVNQENKGTTPVQTDVAGQYGQQTERTFTQADLDRIVAERLQRERAKYPDYEVLKDKAAKFDSIEEASKSELQKATELAAKEKTRADDLQRQINMMNARNKISAETGVPASLLTGSTEEECKAQAEALKQWRGPTGYPDTRDPGTIPSSGGGKTRDQFSDWFKSNLNK